MSSAMYMSIHNTKTVRVRTYFPKNSNSITLSIDREEDGEERDHLELCLFGLSDEKAVALVKALGDGQTTVYEREGSVPLADWLATKDVFQKLEGKG